MRLPTFKFATVQYSAQCPLLSRYGSRFRHACLSYSMILSKPPPRIGLIFEYDDAGHNANARYASLADRESRGESSSPWRGWGAIFSNARDACPIRRVNK